MEYKAIIFKGRCSHRSTLGARQLHIQIQHLILDIPDRKQQNYIACLITANGDPDLNEKVKQQFTW